MSGCEESMHECDHFSLLSLFEDVNSLSIDTQTYCAVVMNTKGFLKFQSNKNTWKSFKLEWNESLKHQLKKKNNNKSCLCQLAYNTVMKVLKGLEDTEDKITICKYFNKDGCQFRKRCINIHLFDCSSSAHNSLLKSEFCKAAAPSVVHQRGSKKSIGLGVDSPVKKKLRTATDVINRITWDESYNAQDLIVGYLDRFIGIVEKPFGSFNWETDISLLSHEELAIPKHRIQYLKLKDKVIWDKRNRIDKIFDDSDSETESS